MEEIIIKLDNFEGPLDLLLFLIDKKKLKIQEVNIMQLIDEYLEILRGRREDELELKVEFVYIASELLEIKALEIIKSEHRADKEKDLKRRLEEYKVIKELSVEISKLQKEYNISYTKNEGRKIIKRPSKEYNLKELKQMDLFSEFKKFIENPQEEYLTLNIEKAYSLEQEVERIYLFVAEGERSMAEIFRRAENRQHLIYIFLGILEMYKDGLIFIDDDLTVKMFSHLKGNRI